MKIRKKETSIGIVGKILNAFSSSKQDTYSCDFINNKITAVEDSLKATVLYEDSIGTIGTVNLAKSLTNFKYVEIFGYDDSTASRLFKKIESPGVGTIYFCFSEVINAEGVNTILFKTKKYNLSANKIETNIYGKQLNVEVNVTSNSISSSNREETLYINKVVGYK